MACSNAAAPSPSGVLRLIILLETAVPLAFTVLLGTVLASIPVLACSIAAGRPYPSRTWISPWRSAAVSWWTWPPLTDIITRHNAIRYEWL
ncbi:hypothetical protein EDD29_5189 [Actinocorallia herbida]|uniref:Uncharacterized protein n=1 Tax=Actinocorallia herbida TaxID=58109 RepID=A0A3N1D259_9ACTN|nr:hypothetical protein [Actinocorallia herbida]ROO87576.1 hypothetical protein EDD29_5189 [Actinocorallia herbida]